MATTHTITFTAISVGSATGTLTFSGQPSNNQTFVIGSKTYTFQTTLTNVDGHITVGSDAANTATNTYRAINGTGGSGENAKGTGYAAATVANVNVTATNPSSGVVTVTAISAGVAGNVVATTAATNTAWDSDTLEAGTLTGGESISITATDDTGVTHAPPAQQTTIANLPAGNARWSRRLRLTELSLFIERNLTDNVAVYTDSLVKLARNLIPALTWSPVITTQPVADSCIAGSTAAEFTCTAVSEVSADQSYAWKESSDGVTYGVALTTTGIYVVTPPATAGDPSTLTISPANTDKTGYYYRCDVTNTAGTTQSSAAIMTVTAAP